MMSENAPQDDYEQKQFEPEKSSGLGIGEAARTVFGTEVVKDSTRQVVDGALVGTCLVFIVGMLSLSGKQIDSILSSALTYFAIAIPPLILGFIVAIFRPKAGSVGPYVTALRVFNFACAIVEVVGYVFVALGVYKVIEHLNISVSSALLWSAVIAVAIAFIIAVVILFLMGWSENRKGQDAMKGRTLKQIQQYQKRERNLKYYLAWFAWVPVVVTLIVAIIDAVGLLPSWGKWIVVVGAFLTFVNLWFAIPQKDKGTKMLDSMKKGK